MGYRKLLRFRYQGRDMISEARVEVETLQLVVVLVLHRIIGQGRSDTLQESAPVEGAGVKPA